MNNIPRRNRLDLCKPEELAIYNAIEQVEKMGASPELTDAVTKLQEARELVADFIDKSIKTWRDVRTYEDAVEMRPVDEDNIIYPTDRPHIVAFKKLCHIIRVINENWQPDWSNTNQRKWYPWFKLSSGFGFSGSYYDYVNASTAVGSRLCLESEEKSKYTAKQFIGLYEEFLTVKTVSNE
jgi:hypothetical protein